MSSSTNAMSGAITILLFFHIGGEKATTPWWWLKSGQESSTIQVRGNCNCENALLCAAMPRRGKEYARQEQTNEQEVIVDVNRRAYESLGTRAAMIAPVSSHANCLLRR
jgi:hypothetical protein